MAIIKIDYKKLSDDALRGVIKEFIFEQTMNLPSDIDIEIEIEKAKKMLEKGKVEILFDDEKEELQMMIL